MSNQAIPLNIKNVNNSVMALKWKVGLLVLLMSATWLTATGVGDLEALSPWIFLLDSLFLLLLFVWLRRRKATKSDNMWESAFPLE